VVAFLALAVTTLAQLLYAIHFYKPHFQSDDAVLNMLAAAMWEQRTLFPEGWITNNGDLMVPSGALLVAPLLSWMPNGFHAHAVAGVFAIVVMLAIFAWFLRQGTPDKAIIAVASAICASGLSWYCAHAIYQQTTYLWWPAGFFLGATLIWKFRQREDTGARPKWLGPLLFFLVFAICFANPARTAIMLVFPLYVFDRALVAVRPERPASLLSRLLRRLGLLDSFVMAGLGAAFLAAAIAYALLMHAGLVTTQLGASSLHWAGWTTVARNFVLFLEGWFPLLGSNPGKVGWNEGLLSVVLELGRLLIAAWLTWVAASEILTVHKQRDRLRRALAAALLGAFLPIFLLYVFLAPLAVDTSTMRYFIVPVFILLVLAAVRASHSIERHLFAFSGLLIAVAVVVALTSAQRFVFHAHQPWSDFWRVAPSMPMQLADTLEREGLHWGYATWWSAGAATVMSDSAVRVNPVTLTNGQVRPFPTMVLQSWYAPESWRRETFLALDASEASDQNIRALSASLGEPARIVQSPGHQILVYDHNIMGCASGHLMSEKLGPGPVAVTIVAVEPQAMVGGEPARVVVELRNDTDRVMSGSGIHPISIGMRLVDTSAVVRDSDWVHWPLACDLERGAQRRFVVPLPVVPDGDWTVQVDLVQEGVAWFHQWGGPMASFALPFRHKGTPDGVQGQ
jgi:hypothetical protein